MVDFTSAPTQDIPDLLKNQYLEEIQAKILRIQDTIAQLTLLFTRTQKKRKWVQNILLTFSCLTTAGFFTFLGLGENVMAIVSGSLSAGNTVLSVLSANWRLDAKVDFLGEILSDFYRVNSDLDYLGNRITAGDCTAEEIVPLLKDLDKQEKDIIRKMMKKQNDLPSEAMSLVRQETSPRPRALDREETSDPILAEMKKNW